MFKMERRTHANANHRPIYTANPIRVEWSAPRAAQIIHDISDPKFGSQFNYALLKPHPLQPPVQIKQTSILRTNFVQPKQIPTRVFYFFSVFCASQFWGAFDSAKNHDRQRRKSQSVTAKRQKSQTPKFVEFRLGQVKLG